VQTTPIGLKATEIPAKWLSCLAQSGGKQLFYDMVYSPDGKPTPLVAFFSELGVRSVDGTDMLVEQARLSFQFWTGKLPPFELMKSALEAARAERARQ
jgi:shikimate 5-dehydrogenase